MLEGLRSVRGAGWKLEALKVLLRIFTLGNSQLLIQNIVAPQTTQFVLKQKKKSFKMSRIIKKYIRRFYSNEKDVCFLMKKKTTTE